MYNVNTNGDITAYSVWHSSQRHWSSTAALPPAKVGKAASVNEQREFVSMFPDIVRDLSLDEDYKDIPDAQKWFSKVCNVTLLLFSSL